MAWRGAILLRGAGVKDLTGFVHVVDDDASFRQAIERRLKQAGYEVVSYPFGPGFIGQLANRKRPELHLA